MNLYDKLFNMAGKVFADHNPCQFNADGQCARYQAGLRWNDYGGYEQDTACCGGCDHLTDKGCTIKCLWCRTWTCTWLTQNDLLPEYAIRALRAITTIAQRNGMIIPRGKYHDKTRAA